MSTFAMLHLVFQWANAIDRADRVGAKYYRPSNDCLSSEVSYYHHQQQTASKSQSQQN